MIRYDPYSCLKFKKCVQISTTEYCNKVTYNHMLPFTSTVGGKIKDIDFGPVFLDAGLEITKDAYIFEYTSDIDFKFGSKVPKYLIRKVIK